MKLILILACAVMAGTILPAVTEFSSIVPVLAQTDLAPDGAFNPERFAEKIITGLGSLAFMGWLCHHMVAKALPLKDEQLQKNQERFEIESQKQRDEHRATVTDLVSQLRNQTDAVLEITRSCRATAAESLAGVLRCGGQVRP